MIDRSRLERALDLLGTNGRIHARLQPIGTGWLCNEMIDLDNPVSQDIIQEPKRWKLVKAHGVTPMKAANKFLKILPRRINCVSITNEEHLEYQHLKKQDACVESK